MTTVAQEVARAAQLILDRGRAEAKTLVTPVCNILGYGAKGDGFADDTLAFMKAFQDAREADLPIYLPEGRYVIRQTLPLFQGARIIGAAMEKTVILNNHDGYAFEMPRGGGFDTYGEISNLCISSDYEFYHKEWRSAIRLNNNLGTRVRNVRIDGHAIGVSIVGGLPNLAHYCVLDGVQVYDAHQFGVYITADANANHLRNCGFFNCKVGVRIEQANSIVIDGCWFETWDGFQADTQILLERAFKCTLLTPRVEASGKSIHVTSEAKNTLIIGAALWNDGNDPNPPVDEGIDTEMIGVR